MKKTIYTLSLVFILCQNTTAQFLGGGTGTEEDPFRIYTIEHFEQFADTFNLQTSSYGNFTGMHVRLMNDITDTIRTKLYASTFLGYIGDYPNVIGFDGYFHGGGHSLMIDLDTNTIHLWNNVYTNYEDFFIRILSENGKIDSLTFLGAPKNFISIVGYNSGVISHVHSKLLLTPPLREGWILAVICRSNYHTGVIEYCKNYSNLANVFVPSWGLPDRSALSGICWESSGLIRYCSNYGNISLKDGSGAGIATANVLELQEEGKVEYCINTGNITSINTTDNFGFNAGICGVGLIKNCLNTGNISYFNGQWPAAGIAGVAAGTNSVYNCFNSGEISGYLDFTQNIITGGGIAGVAIENSVNNNLNIANCKKSAIVDSISTVVVPFGGSNNYYDKQMCRVKGISTTQDLPNQTIGKLTSELTGTSIALQNMLGNGWSYAEGRYPIPLGLENDSVALVAATPIYLYAQNNLSYDHIDSVAHHFPVGLENNVMWENSIGVITVPYDTAFL